MQHNWIGKSRGLQFRFETIGRTDGLRDARGVHHPSRHALRRDLRRRSRPTIRWRRRWKPTRRSRPSSPNAAAPGTSEEAVETAEKRGIDTGVRVIHPLDPAVELPVLIANFILMDYGTGAIFGCPAHDQRDLDFCRRYGLPVIDVFAPRDSDARVEDVAFVPPKTEPVDYLRPVTGVSRMTGEEAVESSIDFCEARGIGAGVTKFRLRDWGISRQRYWGCPIPVLHCPACGVVPEARDKLPVRLPDDVSFDRAGQPARAPPHLDEGDLPEVRRRGAARDRHDGHLRRLVLVLRALHRAERAGADRHGRRRLLDERRPVHRRGRARDPAPALLAVLRAGDDADRAPAGDRDRAVRRAVHPGHGHARDLFDDRGRARGLARAGEPCCATRPGRGWRTARRSRSGRRPRCRSRGRTWSTPTTSSPATVPTLRAGSCSPTARPTATSSGRRPAPRRRTGISAGSGGWPGRRRRPGWPRPGEELARATHRAIRDVTADIEGFAFNKAIARLYELTAAIGRRRPPSAGRR